MSNLRFWYSSYIRLAAALGLCHDRNVSRAMMAAVHNLRSSSSTCTPPPFALVMQPWKWSHIPLWSTILLTSSKLSRSVLSFSNLWACFFVFALQRVVAFHALIESLVLRTLACLGSSSSSKCRLMNVRAASIVSNLLICPSGPMLDHSSFWTKAMAIAYVPYDQRDHGPWGTHARCFFHAWVSFETRGHRSI